MLSKQAPFANILQLDLSLVQLRGRLPPKMIRRILWMTLFVGLLGWLVGSSFSRRRHAGELRDLLLTVQPALQKYHVDQERYLPREKLSGSELISVLLDFGFLESRPLNPWTRQSWKLDGEEPDYLVYETDPNFETYALRIVEPKTGQVILEIDSEENPSLE